MTNKKVAVFWDWNGTIVNDSLLFVDIMNVFLLEKKLNAISVDDYKRFFEFPIKNYYLNLGFDFKDESFESLGRRFIKEYTSRQYDARLFPGIRRLLINLKQKNCLQFVVSAQENSLLQRAVFYYKVDSYFSSFVGVSNIFAKGKVGLAISLYKQFLDPSYDVFLVGDTMHDIEVARSINATPVLVSYGHCDKEKLFNSGEIVVDSVLELSLFFLR